MEKGTLEELMRTRIRATIEAIVDEELKGVLGAAHAIPPACGHRCELATATASVCAR